MQNISVLVFALLAFFLSSCKVDPNPKPTPTPHVGPTPTPTPTPVTLVPKWFPMSTTGAPEVRKFNTFVWTGTEALVFGGNRINEIEKLFSDLFAYNPKTDSWRKLKDLTTIEPRFGHTAVWTGTEMLVWGGAEGMPMQNGARYNLAADQWTVMNNVGAPMERYFHKAVWTGTKMIVWGGLNLDAGALNNGALYDPANNSWSPVSNVNAPSSRHAFSIGWTGSKMIVWGGYNSISSSGGTLQTGGVYTPATDTWTQTNVANAPSSRARHVGVWTGSKFLVWGGMGETASGVIALGDGGIYDPATDQWTPMSTEGAPSARSTHSAVWTGSKMIVWGGLSINGAILNDGAAFDPSTNKWETLPGDGSPSQRFNHTAVWADDRMIIWGGANGRLDSKRELNTGGLFAWVPES